MRVFHASRADTRHARRAALRLIISTTHIQHCRGTRCTTTKHIVYVTQTTKMYARWREKKIHRDRLIVVGPNESVIFI